MDKSDKINFEEEFEKALRSYGYGFPETEDEVAKFEEEADKIEIPNLPPMENPSEILKKGKIKKFGLTHSLRVDHSAVQNMARAAREGKSISEATKRKMIEDRKRAEENQED
ncbi:MAG: hypothetical protein DHS20C18_19280 [Saprospiraceae bacterium]|nr:MAG: hypothetical protein DHS20C18_19280 [Saprospiraceae bacterium]